MWKENGNRKKRIKTGALAKKLMLLIVAVIAGTVLLGWFVTGTFIENYYTAQKQKTILNSFFVMDEAGRKGVLASKEFDVTFDNLCANGNIMIMVISPDSAIVRSSVNDNRTVYMEFMGILFGNADRRSEVIGRADGYELLKRRDERLGGEYLVLTGVLSDGNLVLMRTALESVRESAHIANRFLLFVGALSVLFGSVLAVFVARGITTPIGRLTEISKKMTELDFEAKYSSGGRRRDEIDELGEHFNHLSDTLERTISELKSANNELLRDIEKKDQIDRMRSEFLSNVSHELKTPLAIIQGYAEGLLDCVNEDAESRAYYCEVIVDEAAKMNQMVQKLLTLNQLEFGEDAVEMKRFDITELISGKIASMQILLEQGKLTLDFSEKMPIYVWGDEFKVEEVLTNYLTNAIHYAKSPGIIRIFCTRLEKCVRISVFNTGDPIPPEEQERIWEKFYKTDRARTREYGGNGIGLSIVKAIMQSFHQQCGVVNHPDGVEFWFELDSG